MGGICAQPTQYRWYFVRPRLSDSTDGCNALIDSVAIRSGGYSSSVIPLGISPNARAIYSMLCCPTSWTVGQAMVYTAFHVPHRLDRRPA